MLCSLSDNKRCCSPVKVRMMLLLPVLPVYLHLLLTHKLPLTNKTLRPPRSMVPRGRLIIQRSPNWLPESQLLGPKVQLAGFDCRLIGGDPGLGA